MTQENYQKEICIKLRPYTERMSLDGDKYCFRCDWNGNPRGCPKNSEEPKIYKESEIRSTD
jgi:hypothetical protein